MKTILAMCALILASGGYFLWRSTQLPTKYGQFMGAQQVAVADVLSRPNEFLGKTVSMEGRVTEQCKSMGCFFFFPSENGKLRVELKDIAMTAPMREGRPARVEGQIVTYSDGYQLYATAVEFE
jgi:hypothetical protein